MPPIKYSIMKLKNYIWHILYLIVGVLLFISNYIFSTSDFFNSFSFVLMLSGIGIFVGLLIKNKKQLRYNIKTKRLLLYIVLFNVLYCSLLLLFFQESKFTITGIVVVFILSAIISFVIVIKKSRKAV